jgi:DNA-binding NtrC family response regulator
VSDETTIDATQVDGPAPSGPARAYLILREGDRTEVLNLDDGDEIVLGRSSEATARIEDAKASREHARVSRRGGAIKVVDLGSRNGTLLNQEVLRGEERTLRSGDVLRIGKAELFVAEGAAGARAGTRLDRELARLRGAGEGAVALVRVALPEGESLERLAGALAGAALVEAQGEREWACLVVEREAETVARLVSELRRAAPTARITTARDGGSAAELLSRARSLAGGAPPPAAPVQVPGMVVADAGMVRVLEMVRKVAPTPTTVLILGETGVGKEVVAEQLHMQSPRAKGPFVRLNCGSLPGTLLESELFGYERGAFTGADRRKIGYLEAADGGTLFLDEIGELALPMQAKLLRVLEDRRFMRVGGRDEISVDVRILAATNRDLEAEAKAGRFREDLYFRLSAFVVSIPPLRERPTEVTLLAELFVRQFSERMNKQPPLIAPDALAALRRYRWPGNVRELRNAIERALVLADGDRLGADSLPETVRRAEGGPAPGGAMREQLAGMELKAIEEALAAEGGNQTRAAKRLGISRRALIYKLEKYGLKT